jgi:hypothetical protein
MSISAPPASRFHGYEPGASPAGGLFQILRLFDSSSSGSPVGLMYGARLYAIGLNRSLIAEWLLHHNTAADV